MSLNFSGRVQGAKEKSLVRLIQRPKESKAKGLQKVPHEHGYQFCLDHTDDSLWGETEIEHQYHTLIRWEWPLIVPPYSTTLPACPAILSPFPGSTDKRVWSGSRETMFFSYPFHWIWEAKMTFKPWHWTSSLTEIYHHNSKTSFLTNTSQGFTAVNKCHGQGNSK